MSVEMSEEKIHKLGEKLKAFFENNEDFELKINAVEKNGIVFYDVDLKLPLHSCIPVSVLKYTLMEIEKLGYVPYELTPRGASRIVIRCYRRWNGDQPQALGAWTLEHIRKYLKQMKSYLEGGDAARCEKTIKGLLEFLNSYLED